MRVMPLKNDYYSLVHRLEQGGGVREQKKLNLELWLNIFQAWWMPKRYQTEEPFEADCFDCKTDTMATVLGIPF